MKTGGHRLHIFHPGWSGSAPVAISLPRSKGHSVPECIKAEGRLLALLRRKRLDRFDAQVPTFVKRSEREILTLSGPSYCAMASTKSTFSWT